MRIKNVKGRSWISQFDDSGFSIHITNAEVQEASLKGKILVIKTKVEK